MFRNVFRSVCRDRRGRTLVAGVVGILTGVQCLLSSREVKPPVAAPGSQPAPVGADVPPAPKPRIKISQTRSELGYVYWVVREFGANPSYALFDTWQEAITEVAQRMAAAQPPAAQVEASLVTA
ncbi:MAG TPA: hypothetical protein VH302_13555 [Bryobacteraceae bacterium]|jgi:hypothetical protein|nr:hypothetical protein [Bryobacteraceae bacterium]